MLNGCGKNKHLALVSDFRVKAFTLFSLMLAVGFSEMTFIKLKKPLLSHVCWVFSLQWLLGFSGAFPTFETLMWFYPYFTNIVYCVVLYAV